MLKKILATALAAAMIFGLASVALAAAFSDTAGVKNEAAIVKLASLGLLNGYPDGSFRPAGNITRAEFAAVVVRALGYESSARLLTGAPAFPDCAGAQWAWGYINIAVSQGIVKGYPDGTFMPNANVTVAEAVTMLVRAVGRDEQATGVWPAGHIMVASTVKMLPSDLPGVDVPATRGIVSQLVTNVLGVEIVKKDLESGKFYPIDAPNTFLARNDADRLEGWTVSDVDTTNAVVTLSKSGEDDEEKSLASVYSLVGATTVSGLKGQKVDVLLNDLDEIVYIGRTEGTGIAGKVTAIDKTAKTITVGGKDYEVVNTAKVYFNGDEVVGDAVNKISNLEDADVTLVLDLNGKVTWLDAVKTDLEGTIDEKQTVAGGVNKIKIGATWATLDSDVSIVRNGVSATWVDLAVGDSIKYAVDPDGLITYVDAYAVKVSGILQERVQTNNHYTFKLNDVVYAVEVDEDGDDDFADDLSCVPGAAVTITLGRAGKVTKIAPQATTTTAILTIQSKVETYDAQYDLVQRITLSDGTIVSLKTDAPACEIRRNCDIVEFSNLKTGDSVIIEESTAGKVTELWTFASVSGTVDRDVLPVDEIFYVKDSNGDRVAKVTFSTDPITNPSAKQYTSSLMANGLPGTVTAATNFVTGDEVKISSWNLTTDRQFANFTTRHYSPATTVPSNPKGTGWVVKAIQTSGNDVVLLVHRGTDGDRYIKLTADSIIHKSDAAIAAKDVAVGNKVKFERLSQAIGGTNASTDVWIAKYIYVSTDTTAPDWYDDGWEPHYEDPNSHGHGAVASTVYFKLTEDSIVSYKIYDSDGHLVYSKSFSKMVEIPGYSTGGERWIEWDGISNQDHTVTGIDFTMVLQFKDYTGNTNTPYSVKFEK